MMRGKGLGHAVRSAPFSLRDLPVHILQKLGAPSPSSWSFHDSRDSAKDEVPFVVTECVYDCRNPLPLRNRIGPRLLAIQDGTHKLVIDFHSDRDVFFDVQESRDAPLKESALPLKKRVEMYVAALNHVRGREYERKQTIRLEERVAQIAPSLAE
jgi:hypothetical protein